jgi:ABC-type uncharacterized transport system substrate-binding protein
MVTVCHTGRKGREAGHRAIPIVFLAGNPVLNGVVPGLAHPGGNATGVALQVVGAVKASQVLKDAVPKIARVVYLYDPRSTPPDRVKTLEDNVDLKRLGLTVRPIPFAGSDDGQGIAKKVGSATHPPFDTRPDNFVPAQKCAALPH